MWSLLVTLLIAPQAQAAFQATAQVLATPTPIKRWAAEISGQYSGSFRPSGDEDRKTSMNGLAKVAYKFSERLALQGIWGFNQTLEPSQEFQITNPEFRIFYRLLGAKTGWSLSAGPTAAFPLSQASRDESLYFAMGAATRTTFNNQTEEEEGFKFYYDLGFNRNVHQYETSNTAESNTMSSLDHYFYFEYGFESPFALSTWFGFSSAWSYDGVINNQLTTGQEISYTLSKLWELGLGHERGGDFLSPSGQSYHFSLYDPTDSRFYLSMKLTL